MATPAGASIITGANYKVPKRRHPILQFIILQPTGALGLAVILVMMIAAIFADVVAPYDPVAVDFGAMLGAPSIDHFFGTDAFGRDVFSRIIYGARTALAVGFLSAITGCTIGAIIGVVAAYFGGKIDMAISALIDIMLSFPIIVLALVVVAILGKGQWLGIDFNLIGAIAIPVIPKVARVLRSSALAIREMPYVDAARAAGYRRCIASRPPRFASAAGTATKSAHRATAAWIAGGLSSRRPATATTSTAPHAAHHPGGTARRRNHVPASPARQTATVNQKAIPVCTSMARPRPKSRRRRRLSRRRGARTQSPSTSWPGGRARCGGRRRRSGTAAPCRSSR
jgi:ABC-type amino acid transport system permease subunit